MIKSIFRELYRIRHWAAIQELIDLHHCEQFAREMQAKYAVGNGK